MLRYERLYNQILQPVFTANGTAIGPVHFQQNAIGSGLSIGIRTVRAHHHRGIEYGAVCVDIDVVMEQLQHRRQVAAPLLPADPGDHRRVAGGLHIGTHLMETEVHDGMEPIHRPQEIQKLRHQMVAVLPVGQLMEECKRSFSSSRIAAGMSSTGPPKNAMPGDMALSTGQRAMGFTWSSSQQRS